MKFAICLMMLSVAGCASVPTDNAICKVSEAPRNEHTEALLEDGGPKSARTGLVLIETLDRACD